MKLRQAQKGLKICDELVGRNYAESYQIEILRDMFEAEINRHRKLSSKSLVSPKPHVPKSTLPTLACGWPMFNAEDSGNRRRKK